MIASSQGANENVGWNKTYQIAVTQIATITTKYVTIQALYPMAQYSGNNR
jgi:hypothetical protein